MEESVTTRTKVLGVRGEMSAVKLEFFTSKPVNDPLTHLL